MEGSLRLLQTDRLVYYAHRIPAGIDMEALAEIFSELAKEGKILAWWLSEAAAEQMQSPTRHSRSRRFKANIR